MSERYKSERHYALDDFCCNGDCNQGRSCPREPRVVVSDASWFWSTLMVSALGVLGLAVVVFL
jgi:hypothetical protein